MSMLEDLFLEDEAGEAQELERVLEGGGDDYDERPLSPTSDNNEEREDEAEEDKRRVDPTSTKSKRVIKNPRFVLNPARLTGPRGIQVLPDHFKDFKFKGKGHEKEDLDMVLKKLEHWAYRLYPKFGFQDCLKKMETLGKKRPVMVHLKQIRSDQFVSAETVVQRDSSDDEALPPEEPEEDEFDKLLQQQIDIARATPAPGSVKKPAFSTPAVDRSHMMPKATSSPSINDEQRERMLRNRQLAEERRLAKLRNENSSNILITPVKPKTVGEAENNETNENTHHIFSTPVKPKTIEESNGNHDTEIPDEVVARKHNRSNVIDSSDEEDISITNESIVVNVDVHKKAENANYVQMDDSHKSYEEMDVITIDPESRKPDDDFDSLITKDSDVLVINNTDSDEVEEITEKVSKDSENLNENNEKERDDEHGVVDQQVSNIVDNLVPENDDGNHTNEENKDQDNVSTVLDDNIKVKDDSTPKGNKENEDNIEDVMDVDFSEDF